MKTISDEVCGLRSLISAVKQRAPLSGYKAKKGEGRGVLLKLGSVGSSVFPPVSVVRTEDTFRTQSQPEAKI